MSSFDKGRAPAIAAWTSALAMLTFAGATTDAVAQSNLSFELRGGISVPVGDLSEVGDPGGGFGAGIGWAVHDRVSLRADGDLEILSEDVAGGTIMPITYLWHVHGGLELGLLQSEGSPWRIAARGGGRRHGLRHRAVLHEQ